MKNVVHKKFTIFMGITCVEVSFGTRLKQSRKPSETLLKRDSNTEIFSCEYCKTSNNTCF